MKIKVALGIFALMSGMSLTATAQGVPATDAREANLIHSAELSIVSQMVRGLSHSVQGTHEKLLRACPETETELCQAVCPHPIASGGLIEFTIDMIGIGRSDAATDALVNLLGLRLDAGGSEGLDCQILIRGRALLSRLERLQAKSLVEHCQTTFYELKKRGLRSISDVKVEQICRTEAEVSSSRDELLEAIKSGVECPLW